LSQGFGKAFSEIFKGDSHLILSLIAQKIYKIANCTNLVKR